MNRLARVALALMMLADIIEQALDTLAGTRGDGDTEARGQWRGRQLRAPGITRVYRRDIGLPEQARETQRPLLTFDR